MAEKTSHRAQAEPERQIKELTAKLIKTKKKLETEVKDRKLTEEILKITLKELQETKDLLIQSEKLNAVGRLTDSILHEILNSVNIISMRLQLLDDSKAVSNRAKQSLNICKKQLDRISDITSNLRQLSHVSEQNITMHNLNKIIDEVVNIFAPQFKVKNINIDIQYHLDLLLIPMDKDKVQQAILNLISNAIAAMSGQKTRILRITTKLTPSKDYVQVIISDTGTGIDNNHIDKIFSSLFATRDLGKGVGFGLYISCEIIKEHGGKIWAENNEWGGASFIIELPVGKYRRS